MKEISKTYEARKFETGIYKQWEESGYFNPDNLKAAAQPFSISLPPPNATGTLHLGHAVMLAVQDLIIRYKRMIGKKTLWLPGTDHAAIATQNVVEKKLWQEQKKTRFDFSRDEFVKMVGDFAESSKAVIHRQFRAMGASLDWSRERYTLDEGLSRAVREVFVKMYNDGLIYRGKRIVNWCTRCATTLADDEVEYKESAGQLYFIKYGPVTVATTRPETKLGDTALAVHPNDNRYRHLVGKEFDISLGRVKVHVKVIADKVIDQTFGTGVVGVTPAHSAVDFDLAQKHHLPLKMVIDQAGQMTSAAGPYAGLKVKAARQRFVADLGGQLEKVEDYQYNLSICYRCGTPVEPLPSEQWFVAVDRPFRRGWFGRTTLKKLALRAVRRGWIKIIPERFEKIYYHWMENLHDWCISRQIWFGHRVPAWRCPPSSSLIMGFAADVVPQIFKGKRKIYRLRDHGLAIGDRVAFVNSDTGKIFGYGTMTDVRKTTVADIDLNDASHYATYRRRGDLLAAFKRRNPDYEVTPTTVVYLYGYEFEPITRTSGLGCGEWYVGQSAPAVCSYCGSQHLEQDPDTLDTWFSSSLWTFSTLGWPDKTKDLRTYHPTSVMETGYDIVFFWVARMILMTEYVWGDIPFRTVYLHGMVRDKQGRKMSKSLGNGIDPLDMIAKYGADALRLSMIIGTTPGNDIKLYEEKIAGYRNFVNKLWNICRFILLTIDKPAVTDMAPAAITLSDKWILSRFGAIASLVTNKIESFEFSAAGEALYDFTWHELADWYLEIAKVEGGKDQMLNYLLTQLLKLWHPYTPYVTELLWQEAFGARAGLLMVQNWPRNLPPTDKIAEKNFAVIQQIVAAIRAYRAEQKVAPAEVLSVSVKNLTLDHSSVKLVESLRTKVKIVSPAKGGGQPIDASGIELLIKK